MPLSVDSDQWLQSYRGKGEFWGQILQKLVSLDWVGQTLIVVPQIEAVGKIYNVLGSKRLIFDGNVEIDHWPQS